MACRRRGLNRVVVVSGIFGLLLVGCTSASRVVKQTTAGPTTASTTVAAGLPSTTNGPAPAITTSRASHPSTTAAAPLRPVVVDGSLTTVTQDANGQTVNLHVGSRVRVVLSSTYWSFQATSDPSVLQAAGPPVDAPGTDCIPGGGCGTVTAEFMARGPGRVDVVATRTTCGEVRRCDAAQGHFQVTVAVAVA